MHAYMYVHTNTHTKTKTHGTYVPATARMSHMCTCCMHGCTHTYVQTDRHTPVEYGGSHWESSSMYKSVSACQEGLVWMSNSPSCEEALPVCYP